MGEKNPQIPAELNKLLEKLIFLSKIDYGKKINTSSISFDDTDSWYWYTKLKRYFQKQSGEKTADFIYSISSHLDLLMDRYSDNEFLMEILTTYIEDAVSGVRKLLKTYESEPLVISKIEVIIKNFEIKIKGRQRSDE